MKLIFATHNVDKFSEVKSLVSKHIDLLSLSDIGCKNEINETGKTLEENAIIKAQFVKNEYGLNSFADDTGLEVEALNDQPGVYSARYAGLNATYEDNVEKLLREMSGINNRRARFRTIISLQIDDKNEIFEGIVNGQITKEKRGNHGFGYDPVFLPVGISKTFAELNLTEKNKISHRSIALYKFISHLNKIVEI